MGKNVEGKRAGKHDEEVCAADCGGFLEEPPPEVSAHGPGVSGPGPGEIARGGRAQLPYGGTNNEDGDPAAGGNARMEAELWGREDGILEQSSHAERRTPLH